MSLTTNTVSSRPRSRSRRPGKSIAAASKRRLATASRVLITAKAAILGAFIRAFSSSHRRLDLAFCCRSTTRLGSSVPSTKVPRPPRKERRIIRQDRDILNRPKSLSPQCSMARAPSPLHISRQGTERRSSGGNLWRIASMYRKIWAPTRSLCETAILRCRPRRLLHTSSQLEPWLRLAAIAT